MDWCASGLLLGEQNLLSLPDGYIFVVSLMTFVQEVALCWCLRLVSINNVFDSLVPQEFQNFSIFEVLRFAAASFVQGAAVRGGHGFEVVLKVAHLAF